MNFHFSKCLVEGNNFANSLYHIWVIALLGQTVSSVNIAWRFSEKSGKDLNSTLKGSHFFPIL